MVLGVVTHLSWWFLIEKAGIEIKKLSPQYWPAFIFVFVFSSYRVSIFLQLGSEKIFDH